MKRETNKVHSMVFIAISAALMCVCGPLSIPIGPVPISITNFVVLLSAMILGWEKGTISCLVYIAIGTIGVPVFSGFAGGAGKLLGPTGGYIIGFVFLSLIAGLFAQKFKNNLWWSAAGMVIGSLVVYAIGTGWLAFQTKTSFEAALMVGVVPFLLADLVKIIIAAVLGKIVGKKLEKIISR